MATHPPAQKTRRPWTGGRIVLVVLGSIALVVAFALAASGAILLWADRTQRDDDGYVSTSTERLESTSYAITSENIDAGAEGPDWAWSEDLVGKIRIRVDGAGGTDPFVGVGRTSDVNRYLSGVEHDQVRELDLQPFRVDYVRFPGGAPPSPPGEQTLWAASASGPGAQTLDWTLEGGDWSVVVMNADASADVQVALSAAAEAPFLLPLAVVLLVLGVLVLLGGGVLLFLAFREGRPRASPPTATGA